MSSSPYCTAKTAKTAPFRVFKLSGILYVGCGTLASAVCMDKAVTHTLLSAANIEQAHYLWFYADRYFADGEKIRNKIAARLNFPVFVKPANAGSSVGVSKVTAPEKLDAAIRLAAENDTKVVVEEGIVGQEVECAVLGNRGKNVASPVGEIGAGAEFYDYDDKYKNGVAQLFIPARLPEDVAEEVQDGCSCLQPARLRRPFLRGFLRHRKGAQGHFKRDQHAAGLHVHQHVPEALGKRRYPRTASCLKAHRLRAFTRED